MIAASATPAGGRAEVAWQLAIPTVVVAAIGVVAVVQGVWTAAAVLVAFWLGRWLPALAPGQPTQTVLRLQNSRMPWADSSRP